MTSSTIKNNKPLKWATQRVKATTTQSRGVHKRSSSNTSRSTTASQAAHAAINMTAETKTTNPQQEIDRLSNELAFTYDTVATITVHFESLHHAYTSSKPELDKNKSATRLGEMEKELLTAYDDLGLQVTHLERKINKLEKKITQLREQQQQQLSSPLAYDFVSSPCSSTDSSIMDDMATFNYYDDWTLSQIMGSKDQTGILFTEDCSLFQQQQQPISSSFTTNDYYQAFYCDMALTSDIYNTEAYYNNISFITQQYQ